MDGAPQLEETRGEDWVAEHPPDDVTRDRSTDLEDRRADEAQLEEERSAVLRIPSFSLLSPIGGWLAAWGAAVLAIASMKEAGVSVGLGFGIADGGAGLDTGFWAGLWTLLVQAGAFIVGGYVAGRMARVRALAHATLAWALAVLATAADAIVTAARSGGSSVLDALGLPHWSNLDYENLVAIPLVIFTLGALAGALIGGALAAGANRRETTRAVPVGERLR